LYNSDVATLLGNRGQQLKVERVDPYLLIVNTVLVSLACKDMKAGVVPATR
jgi:hypothetical protein